MKVLLDTNILISREDNRVISYKTSRLFKLLSTHKVHLVIHPASKEDIRQDRDIERREINLSKIQAYAILEEPPSLKDDVRFVNIVGEPKNNNDDIDNQLLYAVRKNAVDIFITEDKGIHKKAKKLNIKEQVLDIDAAIQNIEKFFNRNKVVHPPALKEVYAHNINLDDSIFDSLKQEYSGFIDWFAKISALGRKAWIYRREDKSIGAILIYKEENEPIPCLSSTLPSENRLKICTLKVVDIGKK